MARYTSVQGHRQPTPLISFAAFRQCLATSRHYGGSEKTLSVLNLNPLRQNARRFQLIVYVRACAHKKKVQNIWRTGEGGLTSAPTEFFGCQGSGERLAGSGGEPSSAGRFAGRKFFTGNRPSRPPTASRASGNPRPVYMFKKNLSVFKFFLDAKKRGVLQIDHTRDAHRRQTDGN